MTASILQAFLKGGGLVLLAFGLIFQAYLLITTVFFNVPMEFNGRLVGKWEAVAIQMGFLFVWVVFCTIWLFIVAKVFPAADRYWRLNLADDVWVLQQCYSRRTLGRVSPSSDRRLDGRWPGEGGCGDNRGQAPVDHGAHGPL